jgi:hypothetical protein
VPHDYYALIVCRDCGRAEALAARGRCRRCYVRWKRREKPQAAPVKVCRHCGTRRANRGRQLCWTCSQTPGVVDLYAPLRFDPVDRDDFRGGLELPAAATGYPPGTPGKVAVLEARAGQRVALWHARDAVWED